MASNTDFGANPQPHNCLSLLQKFFGFPATSFHLLFWRKLKREGDEKGIVSEEVSISFIGYQPPSFLSKDTVSTEDVPKHLMNHSILHLQASQEIV